MLPLGGVLPAVAGLVPGHGAMGTLGDAAQGAVEAVRRGYRVLSERATGERVLGAAAGLPAVLNETIATLMDSGENRARRRVWRGVGRIHIEVRGLTGQGEGHERLSTRLRTALHAVAGVNWVEINGVLGQVVVDLDEDEVEPEQLLSLVEQTELAHGSEDEPFAGDRPYPPFDSTPAVLAGASLVADCVGLAVSALRRVAPVPTVSLAVRVPVVVAEHQPRLRRLLEQRLGRQHAEMLLAVSNAVTHALTRGTGPLALDALLRLWQLDEQRGRRAVWNLRERELVGATGECLPPRAPQPLRRPTPLAPGPVESCVERTSLAALAAACGELMARKFEPAVQTILATAPKAARMGREAFSARLGRDLARAGVVPMDAAALRLLDRVSTVMIDSALLCASLPRLLSVSAVGERDNAELWSGAQRVLAGHSLLDLTGRGPWRRDGWQLERPAAAGNQRPDSPSGLTLILRRSTTKGRLAHVLVGCELDPLADALVAAARSNDRRLILTQHVSIGELLPWADQTVPEHEPLAEAVHRCQRDGQAVMVVTSTQPQALAAADVGVTVLAQPGEPNGACWAADLVCGPGLAQVWRVLSALDEAHEVSAKSAHLSMGGSALGALVAAAGSGDRGAGLTTSPVYGAALLAQIGGVSSARRLSHRPLPSPRVRGAWHALDAVDALRLLRSVAEHAAAPRHEVTDGTRLPAVPGFVSALARNTRLAPAMHELEELATAVRKELRDPLTPVLALGAAASAAVGSSIDSTLVGSVMAGNALISGMQRMRAERALRALLLAERRVARRVSWTPPSETSTTDHDAFFAGLETAPVETIDAERLRLGEIIALDPSDVIPADARLLVSDGLEVDEASLTGEAAPVAKSPAPTPGAELAERSCMVYEGCAVLAGTGYAVVVATGTQTESGRAAELAGAASTPPGIEGHLADLTKAALPAVGLGGAAVTLLGLMRGLPTREALAAGVAIAVAAVPEGLPLVATVAQSAAARRLSRYGILTRTARALEALGRVDVVCFDKTGTLTEGRLAVVRLTTPERALDMDSPAGRYLLRTAARACPQATPGQALAHATDRAVVDAAAAHNAGDQTWRLLDELPFEGSRGYSASIGTDQGRFYLAVKGAPEVVLEHCATLLTGADEAATRHDLGSTVRAGSRIVTLTQARRRIAVGLVRRLADDGLRVLAVAQATPLAVPAGEEVPDLVHDLTLLGFLAIADAPRPTAQETVRRLGEAGVRVTMVTGDHPATAVAIARDLGVNHAEAVLTGTELDALGEPERIERISQTTVFARISPEQKVRIVHDLQRAGHVVAMTGDGVNDAAAIRLANVGIGLSAHGSTSARAAADIVLTDPDPTRILDALLEGRTLWRSVRDATAILVGGNAGEVAFTVLGTALSGHAPLGTRQVLLVNLLTDMLPALAVALAPALRPQPGEDPLAHGPAANLLGRDLPRLLAVRGTATTLGATAAWQIGRFTGRQRRASTMGLAALVGTQLGQTMVTAWHSPLVVATGALSAAALVAVVETPGVSQFFGCVPLGPLAWTSVTACSTLATLGAALAPRVLFHDQVEPPEAPIDAG